MNNTLTDHLKTGSTTVCRAWRVQRRDGQTLGFTDHDRDLTFEGVDFAARTGLSAKALQQSTGLSVDNSEAVGALSDASVREEDIIAGRFDDAEVTVFLVNWADVSERLVLFRGTFGEITRERGAFRVELRGLTERLNVPIGRVFQPACSAALGDRHCGIDLSASDMSTEGRIVDVVDSRTLSVEVSSVFDPDWFGYGILTLVGGAGNGLTAEILFDRVEAGKRRILLGREFPVPVETGASVRLVAGCDKRAETCRDKFANVLNFRGFPHIPGDDWLRRSPDVTA